jgi:hypothetical protein
MLKIQWLKKGGAYLLSVKDPRWTLWIEHAITTPLPPLKLSVLNAWFPGGAILGVSENFRMWDLSWRKKITNSRSREVFCPWPLLFLSFYFLSAKM